MIAVDADMMTLDDAIVEIFEALDHGRGAECMVCGERAFAVRERTGKMVHACRACGATLEADGRGAPLRRVA